MGLKYIYGLRISHNFFKLDFQIIPRHIIECPENNSYSVDFAIMGEAFSKVHKNRITKFKIFVECEDLNNYKNINHINANYIKANKLKSLGWIEFRYSENQINSEDFSAASDFDKYIITCLQPQDEMYDLGED